MTTVKTKDFFEQFNQAFVDSDIAFIAGNLTDDVVWTMPGQGIIHGKDALVEFLEKMNAENPGEGTLTIDTIISEGSKAAVTGKMTGKMDSDEVKTYMYCDVYLFDEQQNGKIKEMTSFIVEMKE